MTITEFLLARITEDEDAAREWYGTGTVANRRDDFWLAECAAKRRIVKIHADPRADVVVDGVVLVTVCLQAEDCPTLRALVMVYADHPDYREEWRV